MKKLLIASDIHGSAHFCDLLMKRIEEEQPDKILLLGDLLYHGPRNELPEGYDPKKVIEQLNGIRDRLTCCVRGNCDTEVDQMVLDFPMLADYSMLLLGDTTVFVTHGHHHNAETPPPHCTGDLLLCGHTHIPACDNHGDFIYLNPGSVSIPKCGSCHSYMTWEDGYFYWKNLKTGAPYLEYAPREVKATKSI